MQLSDVLSLGNQLMAEHGLISMGWRFELDNAVRRFGLCNHREKIISISQHLAALNEVAPVKDTILHEIAHALVGRGHGHNHVWKAKCREIGAKPERCYKTSETNTPQMRYVANCEGCGKEHQRVKRPDRLTTYSCRCQSHLPWKLRKTLKYTDRHSA